jgi:hypothetical protein
MKKQLRKFDIIIVGGKIVQYLGGELQYGIWIQDIHCKKELSHIDLIQRKATKDETKWFCENTENIYFVKPNTEIR